MHILSKYGVCEIQFENENHTMASANEFIKLLNSSEVFQIVA